MIASLKSSRFDIFPGFFPLFAPQYERVLVSISFMPISNTVHIDGFDVVQELAVLKSPCGAFETLGSMGQ